MDVPAFLQANQQSEDGRILELKRTVRQDVARNSSMEHMDQAAFNAKLDAPLSASTAHCCCCLARFLAAAAFGTSMKTPSLGPGAIASIGGLETLHYVPEGQKQYTQRGKAARRERCLQLLREADQWKLYQKKGAQAASLAETLQAAAEGGRIGSVSVRVNENCTQKTSGAVQF